MLLIGSWLRAKAASGIAATPARSPSSGFVVRRVLFGLGFGSSVFTSETLQTASAGSAH
jgi:hypothetical protein